MGLNNEEERDYNYQHAASSSDFTPAALRQSGIR
jgi:hypothetical protein